MPNQSVTAKSPTKFPPDLLDFLGLDHPPSGPPEKRNAAPAGPRNGVAIGEEAGQLQGELYDLLADLQTADPSPLDRPITITRFEGATAKRQQRITTDLRQFADLIGSTRAASKSALPWLKLASFGDVPTTKGALRHEANMTAIDGVEGDYDGGTVSIAEAVAALEAADIAALVYTTPSHRPAAPRWRVLAPTSAPLNPAERDALAERLNGALGGILARESFARAQAYYFGAVEGSPNHSVRLVEGRYIDAATDVAPLDRYGRAPADEIDLLADIRAAKLEAEEDDDLTALIPPGWERIAGALAFIPADDRDDWLRVGMALHAEGRGSDEAFDAWTEWSRGSEKFDAKDQRRTWCSFGETRGKAVGIGSLFELAKTYGWGAKLKLEAPAGTSRLTFLSPAECAATPSRGYILKGVLAPGDVGCIFGAPGAGKSLISPHIGYAIARGAEAFGMRSKAGKVFYVAAEDPHGMRGRVTALKMRHGDAPGFNLVEGVSDLLSEGSPDLAALLEAVEAQRPSLVFLDTLAMAFPALEENSAEGMGRVVAVARMLAQWGAAVVLIHHDTKAEGKTPRGHSLLNGALDVAMHVSRDEFGVVRARLTKNRNGSCERDIAFTISTENLGQDEDGDPITAALVDELSASPEPINKLSPAAQAAFDILKQLEGGQGADNEPLSGSVRPRVTEHEWRDACVAGRTVSGSEDVENRKRAFRRASAELAREGRTIVRDDFIASRNPLNDYMYGGEGDGLDD